MATCTGVPRQVFGQKGIGCNNPPRLAHEVVVDVHVKTTAIEKSFVEVMLLDKLLQGLLGPALAVTGPLESYGASVGDDCLGYQQEV